MEGYLEKLGDIVKNWKLRYFVYYPQNKEIHYYENSEKTSSLGVIPLNTAVISSFDSTEFNKDFSFGITPSGSSRTYILAADSNALKFQWLASLAPNVNFSKAVIQHDEVPYISGWLTKQGSVVKNWKKRYFELFKTTSEFYYYTDETKSETLGSIPLNGSKLIYSVDEPEQSFCLGISCINNRTFILAAESEYMKRQWIDAVSEVLKALTEGLINVPQYIPRLSDAKKGGRVSVLVNNSSFTSIVKSGWLLKLGGNFKSWKRRWCIITGPMLLYYENKSDDQLKPKGKINLLGGRVAVGNDLDEEFEKQNVFCFTAASSTRRYVFVSDSAGECEEWSEIISNCVTAKGAAQLQKQMNPLSPVEEYDEEDEEKVESTPNSHATGILSANNLVGSLTAMEHNTNENAWDKVKATVSKEKRRFVNDGFNLDLTYITDRIIAMGFPAESFEGMYRNAMEEVQRFFETRHKDHYKVYNLCSERIYDSSRFHGRVLHFPFDDHNCPNFDDMEYFCQDVASYLTESPENVVAIHCKAGKGRTGLMISVFLLYAGVWENPEQALSYYAFARTKNMKGVTIASQIRWVYYFDKYLKMKSIGKSLPPPVAKRLSRIVVGPGAPEFDAISISNSGIKYTSGANFPKFWKHEMSDGGWEVFCGDSIVLTRDFNMTFSAKKYFGASKSTVFGVWVNTQFVEKNYQSFNKKDIDKVCKQKNAKDFKLELFFEATKPEVEQEHELQMSLIDERIAKEKAALPGRRSIDVGNVDNSHNAKDLVKKLEEYKDAIDVDDSEAEDDIKPPSPSPTDERNKKSGLFSSFFQ